MLQRFWLLCNMFAEQTHHSLRENAQRRKLIRLGLQFSLICTLEYFVFTAPVGLGRKVCGSRADLRNVLQKHTHSGLENKVQLYLCHKISL